MKKSNRSTTQVAVRWKGIDKEQLSTPGLSEVTVTVDGTYVGAVAIVTVHKAR